MTKYKWYDRQAPKYNPCQSLYLPLQRAYKPDSDPNLVDVTKLSTAELLKLNKDLHQEIFNAGMGRGGEKGKKELLELNKKLEGMQNGKKATEEELKTTKAQIAALEDETLSSDEKMTKRMDDLKTELTGKIDKATKTSDNYRALFETQMVNNQITEAATKNGAHSPSQVVQLLGASAEVREIENEKGKWTGKYQVVIPMEVNTSEDEDKPKLEMKDLNVVDATKSFLEREENANLLSNNLLVSPNIDSKKGTLGDILEMSPKEIQANAATILERMGKGEFVQKV